MSCSNKFQYSKKQMSPFWPVSYLHTALGFACCINCISRQIGSERVFLEYLLVSAGCEVVVLHECVLHAVLDDVDV